MSGLVKLTTYNIQDSNIALLGSDLEKRVREHAGDKEPAWDNAGKEPGVQIWRIEKFHVVHWPDERKGTFYDGDSYIVLHTYKEKPESDILLFDLHFWLGENTSQDEAGTAAYKTVELDDHLEGIPVQYREVQGYESSRFLSYFPHFVSLHGGVDTGFHHVTSPPPLNLHRLYHISQVHHEHATQLLVRQVAPETASLAKGDVFVLDRGSAVWQLNRKNSSGKVRFKAAEFTRSLADGRMGHGHCDVKVFDEGGQGVGTFLSALGADSIPPTTVARPAGRSLFRISDSTSSVTFEPMMPVAKSSLTSSDAYLFNSTDALSTTIFVWIGKDASLKEQRLALQYGQNYLHQQLEDDSAAHPAVSIVKMREGRESTAFLEALGSST